MEESSLDLIFHNNFGKNIKSLSKQSSKLRIQPKPHRNQSKLTVCINSVQFLKQTFFANFFSLKFLASSLKFVINNLITIGRNVKLSLCCTKNLKFCQIIVVCIEKYQTKSLKTCQITCQSIYLNLNVKQHKIYSFQ